MSSSQQSYSNGFRPAQMQNHSSNFNVMVQTPIQSELYGAESKPHSEMKPSSSVNEARNKESYSLSALQSELKQKESGQKQSFMNKLNSGVSLVKDVSFGGGAHSSFGGLSGLQSVSTCKNKDSSIFPATS